MSVNSKLAVIAALSILVFYLTLNTGKKEPPKTVAVSLTNTDTIRKQIDSLQIKSDTIKVFYEKKIQNYRITPTTERVRLFAERINR
jgi:hypothetical protein